MEIKVAEHLSKLYNEYYPDNSFDETKRIIAAKDSLDAIEKFSDSLTGRIIDVGAGDGFVSQEILNRNKNAKITAVEISNAGLEKIKSRGLPIECHLFDGYKLPFASESFDVAVCAHVMEHVEHERLLLREIARVSKAAYFVVPLEGGARGRITRDTGHINYYTPLTFINLLETGGFSVQDSSVFSCSREYEQHLFGKRKGAVRSLIRQSVLKILGNAAPQLMVYIMAVKCDPTKKE